MSPEFSPADFEQFQNDPDAMSRYEKCASRCLLFNFGGAIAPVISDIVADAQAGESHRESCGRHLCEDCPLSPREHRLTTLLLIDSLL